MNNLPKNETASADFVEIKVTPPINVSFVDPNLDKETYKHAADIYKSKRPILSQILDPQKLQILDPQKLQCNDKETTSNNIATKQYVSHIRENYKDNPTNGSKLPSASYLHEISDQSFDNKKFEAVEKIYDDQRSMFGEIMNRNAKDEDAKENATRIYANAQRTMYRPIVRDPVNNLPTNFVCEQPNVQEQSLNRSYGSPDQHAPNPSTKPLSDVNTSQSSNTTMRVPKIINRNDENYCTSTDYKEDLLIDESKLSPLERFNLGTSYKNNSTTQSKPESERSTLKVDLSTAMKASKEKLSKCLKHSATFAANTDVPELANRLFIALMRVGYILERRQQFLHEFELQAFELVTNPIFENLCTENYKAITLQQVGLLYEYSFHMYRK